MAVLTPTTCVNTGKIAKSAPALPNLIGYVHFGIGRKIIDSGGSNKGNIFYIGSGKSTTVGNPLPSMAMGAFSAITFRLPVVIGARSLTLQCQHVRVGSTFYPLVIRILSNIDVGIPTQLTVSSVDTTAWQTLGPLTFTSPNYGAIDVVVRAKISSPEVVYIDNLDLQ